MTWGDLRMNKFIIAGIGELLWDVLPHIEVIGGAPVNFAYHVTSLGARGIPVSTIGRDSRGEAPLPNCRNAVSISGGFRYRMTMPPAM
jgi:sugar/nucleoside kinase (ribokinase family)